MKFNKSIEKQDFQSHLQVLEDMYSVEKDGCTMIDSAAVHKCMLVFARTFAKLVDEIDSSRKICPFCRYQDFEISRIYQGKIVIQECNYCQYRKRLK